MGKAIGLGSSGCRQEDYKQVYIRIQGSKRLGAGKQHLTVIYNNIEA